MASKHRDDKRGNGAYRRVNNEENEKRVVEEEGKEK